MNPTLTQILGFWLLYCMFGVGLYLRHRSRREATKRTDPQVSACADELETAKSAQRDETK